MAKLPVIPGLAPKNIGKIVKVSSFPRHRIGGDEINTENGRHVVGRMLSYVINDARLTFSITFEGGEMTVVDYDTDNLEVWVFDSQELQGL